MANRGSSGSSVLASTLAGAVLGAAGLAWWLVSETERRQRRQRDRGWRDGELPAATDARFQPPARPRPVRDSELQDRVHQLNQAIEDVRRQLESLSTES